MKTTRLPTLQEMEELTAFLPVLYADGFSPIISWSGGAKGKDGSITMPYPSYHKVVEEFFRVAARECWLDFEYDPEQAGKMLREEGFIKTASLSEIKTMLTFCVRGERFSDGHWGAIIEEGHIRRLLERINEIKSGNHSPTSDSKE
jgi:hypothetical protein